MSRLPEDILTTRVRSTLGAAYDPNANYCIVRPAMVGLPKYAGCKEVGRFKEDSRAGGELVVLLRPPAAPPANAVTTAAERVRSAIAASKTRK